MSGFIMTEERNLGQYKQMINRMAGQSNPQLDVERTALIVVDLVNDSSDDSGFFKTKLGFDISLMKEIEPKVISLIDASKKAKIPVIGVQAIYDFGYIPKPMQERFEAMGIQGGIALKGAWGSEIIPKIKDKGLDLILVKSHYSAFAPRRTFAFCSGNVELEQYMKLPNSEDAKLVAEGERTMSDYFVEAQNAVENVDDHLDNGGVISLDNYLIGKGIGDLIVTGASTHVCISSTIAGASERGYKVFEPIDAIAAEGIPREGYMRHFVYASNDGMFKAELTTTEKLLKAIQK